MLIEMPFDGAWSGRKRYGVGQRRFSPGSFQKLGKRLKSSENNNISGFYKEMDSRFFVYMLYS